MGILKRHIHLLAMEQANHPITGDVLILSQQAVYATIGEVNNVVKAHGLCPKALPTDFDIKPRVPNWDGPRLSRFTNAQTVLTTLGASSVSVADCSSYENPDYIIDLNNTVDSNLHGKFDVIIDAGTLEHIFDIPTALESLSKMLKHGGQIILFLPSSGMVDHGFYSISPTLLFDYFGNNGFDNIHCYLSEGSQFNLTKKAKLYKYSHVGDQQVLISKKAIEVAFFATKNVSNEGKSNPVKPMQSLYANKIWNESGDKDIPRQRKMEGVLKRLSRAINYTLKKYRPDFVNIYRHNKRRKNIKFIGRF